jgi:hypothetical protein
MRVPDKEERLAEIRADPVKWIYFTAIRNSVGEGHGQYVDDMYSTPDGTSVVVSRPGFAVVRGTAPSAAGTGSRTPGVPTGASRWA